MDNKEVEELLYKQAEQVKKENAELMDFSAVWEEIKGDIQKEQKSKKRLYLTFASITAAIAILFSVLVPVLLKQKTEDSVYLADQLEMVNATKESFFNSLAESALPVVDFQKYEGSNFSLLQTIEASIQGGFVELKDIIDVPIVLAKIYFYSKYVKLNTDVNYENDYTTNSGAKVKYSISEENNGTYIYKAKAEYNTVKYIMEITVTYEDVTLFFEEFFS